MEVKTYTFIGCENCRRQFGGPRAGEYFDWNDESAGCTITEFLVAEAMDLGWIRVQWYGEDVLICSPSCVSKLDERNCKRWKLDSYGYTT